MPVFKNCQRTAASDINILKPLTPDGEQKQLEEDTVWKQKILQFLFKGLKANLQARCRFEQELQL